MNRRELLQRTAAFGLVGAAPLSFSRVAANHYEDTHSGSDRTSNLSGPEVSPLKPPAHGHHGAYKTFAVQFPDIRVKRGARFVNEGNVATAGGLSSGIDLALRVVERYFGREVASQTAYQMEYQGQGWLDPASNQVYAKAPISTDEHPLCPVCDMDADKTAPKSVYQGKTYYFCMPEHKALFDKAPEKYLQAAQAQ